MRVFDIDTKAGVGGDMYHASSICFCTDVELATKFVLAILASYDFGETHGEVEKLMGSNFQTLCKRSCFG